MIILKFQVLSSKVLTSVHSWELEGAFLLPWGEILSRVDEQLPKSQIPLQATMHPRRSKPGQRERSKVSQLSVFNSHFGSHPLMSVSKLLYVVHKSTVLVRIFQLSIETLTKHSDSQIWLSLSKFQTGPRSRVKKHSVAPNPTMLLCLWNYVQLLRWIAIHSSENNVNIFY